MSVACGFLIPLFLVVALLALGVLRYATLRALRSALTGARRAHEASDAPLSRWALIRAAAARSWLWFFSILVGVGVVLSMLNNVRRGLSDTCALAGMF